MFYGIILYTPYQSLMVVSFFVVVWKANEELTRMFPSFCEISSGGNALDRVFALEIELAEALKTKNKSNIQFQR